MSDVILCLYRVCTVFVPCFDRVSNYVPLLLATTTNNNTNNNNNNTPPPLGQAVPRPERGKTGGDRHTLEAENQPGEQEPDGDGTHQRQVGIIYSIR